MGSNGFRTSGKIQRFGARLRVGQSGATEDAERCHRRQPSQYPWSVGDRCDVADVGLLQILTPRVRDLDRVHEHVESVALLQLCESAEVIDVRVGE